MKIDMKRKTMQLPTKARKTIKIWQNKQNNAKIDKCTKNNVESKVEYVSVMRHGRRAYSALTKVTWYQDVGVMRSQDMEMKAKFEGHFVNVKIIENPDKLAMLVSRCAHESGCEEIYQESVKGW